MAGLKGRRALLSQSHSYYPSENGAERNLLISVSLYSWYTHIALWVAESTETKACYECPLGMQIPQYRVRLAERRGTEGEREMQEWLCLELCFHLYYGDCHIISPWEKSEIFMRKQTQFSKCKMWIT